MGGAGGGGAGDIVTGCFGGLITENKDAGQLVGVAVGNIDVGVVGVVTGKAKGTDIGGDAAGTLTGTGTVYKGFGAYYDGRKKNNIINNKNFF